MPPKKQPSKLAPQGSALNPPPSARVYRHSVAVPAAPPSESIPSLWTPGAAPTEAFPEWTDPTALPSEHWGTADEPFEDALAPDKLLLPLEAIGKKDEITWKRPSQFLPVIVDTPAVPATPPPPTPEPKVAKKAPIAAKKGDPEPPKKLIPPKHAHVFLPKSREKEYGFLRGDKAGAATASTAALPATAAASDHHDHARLIPRDFQRRWSAEQTEALEAWAREEERIEREQQHRERVYMGFEDTIAYIVNERPRDVLAEVDFDADDLVDDGEDEDDAATSEMDVSNATSPWGVMPPPRVEIAPNAVYKPEVPHGEVIHADIASIFRLVEQLYDSSVESNNGDDVSPVPFLWQAVYPQDSAGHPMYNPGGKYSVKLFVFGRWRRVDVDDLLPVDADGNVVYLASSMRSEIWPSLLVKALYKAEHWMHPNGPEAQVLRQSSTDGMCQNVVQIVLSLTSWKVSRWGPHSSQSLSENVFHQLLQYVPSAQQAENAEDNAEAVLDAEAVADGAAEAPPEPAQVSDEPVLTHTPKPRAVICCAGSDRVGDMVFGEVALVADVVGDAGSTTFKVVRQGSPAAISEEASGVSELVFLLVHPVRRYFDTFVRAWVPSPDPPLEGAESRAALVPFEPPRVQFVVVSMPARATEQSAGDSSTDTPRKAQVPVDLVATLTPVQPQESLDPVADTLQKSSELMATHLGVDPNGSVILIEELERKTTSRSALPAIVTLNSLYSSYIDGAPLDADSIVYRVYPQKTLRYGYSLQVESDHKVVFQDAPTYWRSLNRLHVDECEGAYPVMRPETWNLLFKHSFELIPPPEDGPQSLPELRIDLHLSEELLAGFTHISIVNDATGEVKQVSTLCAKVTLSGASPASVAYTLVVDCCPGSFHVREGKWKLTLASEWEPAKATTHQVKMTRFEGTYEPNKPLLCFRDVVMAPKASIWASFQLELFRSGALAPDLAAKLEVFDLGADQHPRIGEVSSKGQVRLLQLPCPATAENAQPPADDKRGYILQGSVDRSSCVVPADLQSQRPFRSSSNCTPPTTATTTSVDENAPSEVPSDPLVPGTARSFRAPSELTWRLNCWSSEEVKLQEDNTKELQFEAIRASWAEKAVDRNTNGAVSRLLYLGKEDEAEARMKQDCMTEEQSAKVRSRFEWVEAAKSKVASSEGGGGSYLEEVTPRDEVLLSDDQLAESRCVLLERIGVVEADREQRRVARALAKEERATELRSLVRSVIEKRAASLKKQQELKRELSAVQTQSA